MLDDVDRAEVGKLRDDFLTDEQGRRIYCASFGSARWVPSLEEEDNLRRLKFRVLFVGMAVAFLGATALSIWWDEGSSLMGMWVVPVFGTLSKKIAMVVLALMLPAILLGITLSTYRAWAVLRKRI